MNPGSNNRPNHQQYGRLLISWPTLWPSALGVTRSSEFRALENHLCLWNGSLAKMWVGSAVLTPDRQKKLFVFITDHRRRSNVHIQSFPMIFKIHILAVTVFSWSIFPSETMLFQSNYIHHSADSSLSHEHTINIFYLSAVWHWRQ